MIFEEGGSKSTWQRCRYDRYGNVVAYLDVGDSGSDDDVSAEIAYQDCSAQRYLMDRAKAISVFDASSKLLRKRGADIDSTRGDAIAIRQYVESASGGGLEKW